jgi:hypothetical protein
MDSTGSRRGGGAGDWTIVQIKCISYSVRLNEVIEGGVLCALLSVPSMCMCATSCDQGPWVEASVFSPCWHGGQRREMSGSCSKSCCGHVFHDMWPKWDLVVEACDL